MHVLEVHGLSTLHIEFPELPELLLVVTLAPVTLVTVFHLMGDPNSYVA